MGLFDALKKKDNTQNSSNEVAAKTGGVNLSKNECLHKINLNKEEVHKVCLSKGPLNNLTSRVAVVFDYSGSMSNQYKNGTVQSVLEKLLPIAMEFDDNGSMEVWLFEDGFRRMPDMTLDNFYGYVQREIIDKRLSMGGTNYAPVMQDVIKKYMQEEPAKIPNYVIFITDGDNWDKDVTTNTIIDASNKPIFWQFVGLGNASMSYLETLDDMPSRYVDNADFFRASTAADVTYEKLLDEYPGWIANSKVQNMLR